MFTVMKKILFISLALAMGIIFANANNAATGLQYSGTWLSAYDSIVVSGSGSFIVTMTEHTSDYTGWGVSGDLLIDENHKSPTEVQIYSTGPAKGRVYYYYDDNPSTTCHCGEKAVAIYVYKQFDPNLTPYNLEISGPDCILSGDTVVYSIDPILTKNLNQGIGVDEYLWTLSGNLAQQIIYNAGDGSSITFVVGEVTGADQISVQVGLANGTTKVLKSLGKAAPKPTIVSRCITHGEQGVLFYVSDPQPGVKYNWSCSDDTWIIDVDSVHTDSAYISPANDASASVTVIAYYDGNERCSASYTTVKVGRQWSNNARITSNIAAPYEMNKEYEFILEGAAGGGLNWTPPSGWLLLTNNYSSATGYTAKLKAINENEVLLADVLSVSSNISCSNELQTAESPIYMKPAKVLTVSNITCIVPNSVNTFSITNFGKGPRAINYEWKLYNGGNLVLDTITDVGTLNLTYFVTPNLTKLVVIPIGAHDGTQYYNGDATEFLLTFGPEAPVSIHSSKECVAYNMPDEITLSVVEASDNSTQVYEWNIPSVLDPEFQNQRHTSVTITTDGQTASYPIQVWGTGTCGNSTAVDTFVNIVANPATIQYLDYVIPGINLHVKGYTINNYGTNTIASCDWYFFDNGTIVDGLDSNTGQLVNFKGTYIDLQDIVNSQQYGLVCIVTFTSGCKTLITYGAVPNLSQVSLVHAPVSPSAPKRNNETNLLLYPNPTGNDIIVDFSKKVEDFVDLYIVDMNGSVVLSKRNYSLGTKVDLNVLPKGQYIMCAHKGNEHITKPFIKQ